MVAPCSETVAVHLFTSRRSVIRWPDVNAISNAPTSAARTPLAIASTKRSTRGKAVANMVALNRSTVLVPSTSPNRSCAPIETGSPINTLVCVLPDHTVIIAAGGANPYTASSVGASVTNPDERARRNASTNSSACARSARACTGDSTRNVRPLRTNSVRLSPLENSTRSTSPRSTNNSRRRNSCTSRSMANSCSPALTTAKSFALRDAASLDSTRANARPARLRRPRSITIVRREPSLCANSRSSRRPSGGASPASCSAAVASLVAPDETMRTTSSLSTRDASCFMLQPSTG